MPSRVFEHKRDHDQAYLHTKARSCLNIYALHVYTLLCCAPQLSCTNWFVCVCVYVCADAAILFFSGAFSGVSVCVRTAVCVYS